MPNNVRVSVDDVVPEFQLIPLPVPCNELETIGNAAGSFVQWPKDLVTLGQVYIMLWYFSHSITIYHVYDDFVSLGSNING